MSEQAPTYTWNSVLAIVPAPTPEDSALYALEVPASDLVERGAKIRSEKILTDLIRLAGIAAEFWNHASPAQKRHLLGFSWPLLQVLVHSGKKLLDMVEARSTTTEEREANRAAALAVADQHYAQGMDERDRLIVALEGVESLVPSLDSRISTARATVTDHESLSTSLHALVKLGKELLAESQSRAAKQLINGGVTDAELTTIDTLATAVKTVGDHASGARKQGAVTQGDLDLQDGTCLAHLERVMRVFNHAHERDASIPRLIPLTTRRMFAMGRRAPKAPPPAPATP